HRVTGASVFFFQAEDGIRDFHVTGVQTCALPIFREMASQSKAAAQMGNQGHCEDGYRRLCEFVWGGVVGNITETHSWTDRANGRSEERRVGKECRARGGGCACRGNVERWRERWWG